MFVGCCVVSAVVVGYRCVLFILVCWWLLLAVSVGVCCFIDVVLVVVICYLLSVVVAVWCRCC